MELGKVDIGMVRVGERHRALDQENVDRLISSMKAIGLQEPIHVWSPDQYTVELVAGLHRLKAAEALGWDEIPCVFVNLGEAERRMWEIAENLHRAELTVQERAEHIEEWRRLAESRKKGEQLVHPGGKQKNERGVSEAARDLGISRPEVLRAEKIASIAPAAKEAAKAAGLGDNQSALLKVAAAAPDKQIDAVKEEARKREYTDPAEASQKRIAAVQNAYLKLSAEEKGVFLEWLEENEPAIFDVTPSGRAA